MKHRWNIKGIEYSQGSTDFFFFFFLASRFDLSRSIYHFLVFRVSRLLNCLFHHHPSVSRCLRKTSSTIVDEIIFTILILGYYFKTILNENCCVIFGTSVRILDNTETELEWNTYRALVTYFPSEWNAFLTSKCNNGNKKIIFFERLFELVLRVRFRAPCLFSNRHIQHRIINV